jgi:hypothetical protein
MDFGNTLSKAWHIIWNNKVLWIFGILASCGSGAQGGSGSFNYGTNAQSGDLPPAMQDFFLNMERNFNQIPEDRIALILIGLFCLICIFSIIALFLSVYGRVGLIKGTQAADAGASLSFRSVAEQISPFFWRALGLNLLLSLILFVVFLVVGGISIGLAVVTLGFGLLCLIPLFCLAIPLGVVYYVYTQLANNALVVEDLGVGEALSRSWEVMRSRAGDIAVMAIILFVGNLIAGIVIGIPFILLFLPAILAFMGDGAQAANNALTLGIIGLCIAIPLGLVISGFVRSYIESAWTLTYLQVSQPAE